MSNPDLSRRTEIAVKIGGIDISADINKYLISLYFTDNEDDKTDDLRIEIDDREGDWLLNWLNTHETKSTSGIVNNTVLSVGDKVRVKVGAKDWDGTQLLPFVYNTVFDVLEVGFYNPERIVIGLNQAVTAAMHISNLIIEESNRQAESGNNTNSDVNNIKGAEISAVIIQKNKDSDGKDYVLDCGVFEIDSIDTSGPPAQITIKGTSLSYSSTVRTQKKSKAWENVTLRTIANEIAYKNGMSCMFESVYNPLYERREQLQISDIMFLEGLCYNAGISLKVTEKTIVLFDAATYEKKESIREIKKGSADVKSYRFSSKTSDTKYSRCHVSYENPQTGELIEYTYTPRDSDTNGQVLEINEKVNTREEARLLAMKRLRQKNKTEFSADFTLVGDTGLIAGITVDVIGYGLFDNKYIIEKAVHSITGSGYTLQLKLRRVLEDY